MAGDFPMRRNSSRTSAKSRDVRLSRIIIKNYRSCLRTRFLPHPELSCLIGYNSSGKTSVLSAIRLLRSIFDTRPGPYRDETPTGTCRLDAEFSYGRRSVLLRLDVIYSTSGEGNDEVLNYLAQWNFKGVNRVNEWIQLPLGMLFNR